MTHGLVELGEVMLSASERRLETVSRNIANLATPGFKKEISFGDVLASSGPDSSQTRFTVFSQGALRATGGALDFALAGEGLFKLRSESEIYLSRSGQFQRAADGTVRNAQGFALQTNDGADLVLSGAEFEVLSDGTVLENGLPVARIGVFRPDDPAGLRSQGGGLYSADGDVPEAPSAVLHQGMLETSNVEMAGEMMEMMEALREAEVGARIIQLFDTLSGQAVSTFGQGPK